MDKFGRSYILLIQKLDGTTLRITPPFTVEFDIHRNSLSSVNAGQIRVYNLDPNNRRQIRKDQFNYDDQRTIHFFAGYGKNLSLAFAGNITQASSVREGNNMVTQIECFDGGFAYVNAVTATSFNKNFPQTALIDSLIKDLRGFSVSRGAVGNYPGQISRGNSYNGSTTDLLTQVTGGGFFIDNLKANCLNDDECLDLPIPLINASSGLLGTPLLESQYINFEMLFEPNIQICQQIFLQSETEDFFNGTHKVLSLKHRGIISDAVCGEATTSMGLLPGKFSPVPQVDVG